MTTRAYRLQAAMRSAFTHALASHPELAAEADRYPRAWAAYVTACRDHGISADVRAFRQIIQETEARDGLRIALNVADTRAAHQRQMDAARALGARQGRALALREHQEAVLAALDRRITADRERRAKLRPAGPIRIW